MAASTTRAAATAAKTKAVLAVNEEEAFPYRVSWECLPRRAPKMWRTQRIRITTLVFPAPRANEGPANCWEVSAEEVHTSKIKTAVI